MKSQMRLDMPDLGYDICNFRCDALVSEVGNVIVYLSVPSRKMEWDAAYCHSEVWSVGRGCNVLPLESGLMAGRRTLDGVN